MAGSRRVLSPSMVVWVRTVFSFIGSSSDHGYCDARRGSEVTQHVVVVGRGRVSASTRPTYRRGTAEPGLVHTPPRDDRVSISSRVASRRAPSGSPARGGVDFS